MHAHQPIPRWRQNPALRSVGVFPCWWEENAAVIQKGERGEDHFVTIDNPGSHDFSAIDQTRFLLLVVQLQEMQIVEGGEDFSLSKLWFQVCRRFGTILTLIIERSDRSLPRHWSPSTGSGLIGFQIFASQLSGSKKVFLRDLFFHTPMIGMSDSADTSRETATDLSFKAGICARDLMANRL